MPANEAVRVEAAEAGSQSAGSLNAAARYTREGRYAEAMQILAQLGGGFRKGRGGYAAAQIIPLLFREILAVIGAAGDVAALPLKSRNRLLKLVSLAVRPCLAALQAGGRLLAKAGFAGGATLVDLSGALRNTGWTHGLPVLPEFLGERRQLSATTWYPRSLSVYRDIFLAYLDYWLNGRYEIGDLIIASVKPMDAHALYCLVREKAPETALEIGTFVGFSTSIIATAMKDAGAGRLYCIDPGIKHLSVDSPLTHAEAMLQRQGLAERVKILKGFFSDPRSATPHDEAVFGRRLADLVPCVDLAFIDGDHATAAVIQDFTLLLPSLNDNAVVVFHDVRSWVSVRKALLVLLEDEQLKGRVRYYEWSPAGIDGIGVMEVKR